MPRKRTKRRSVTKIDIPEELETIYYEASRQGLLQSTFQCLLQNGYNNISTLSAIEESDIQNLNIPLAQRSVLRKFLKSFTSTAIKATKPDPSTSDVSSTKARSSETERMMPVFRPEIQVISSDDEDELIEHIDNLQTFAQPPTTDITQTLSYEASMSKTASITATHFTEAADTKDQVQEDHENDTFTSPTGQSLKVEAKESALTPYEHSEEQIELGSDPTLTRKNKKVTANNTFVQGATGCIIGENIHIIKHEVQEEIRDPRVKNLEDQTLLILKDYEKEENVFVKTDAYKVIKEELESLHFITISGRPGDGKTFMAMNLLLEYKNRRKCFIIESTDEWITIAGLSSKQIVVVDDVFGTYVYDESRAKPWISRFEKIEKLINQRQGNFYVIFTARTYIVEDVKPLLEKSSIFRGHYILNLSSDEFQLSRSEKLDMLTKHLQHHHLKINDDDEINRIVFSNPPHGFPHCVKLFTTSHFLYARGKSFFQNPVESLNGEIERFRRYDKYKYCVLVLIAMLDCKITSSFFNDANPKSDKMNTLLRVCGLPDSTPLSNLNDALSSLLSVYVRKNTNGCYVFDHETISEAVHYSLSKYNSAFAIDAMSLKFLIKKIKTKSWKQKSDAFSICIDHDMYEHLWKRLLKELKDGKVKQTMHHQAWEDIKFLEHWRTLISKEQQSESSNEFLVTLKNLADEYGKRNVLYWALFYSKTTFVNYLLANIDDESVTVEEMSILLVTASYNGLSNELLRQIIEKGAQLEYIDTANEFTHNIRDPYGSHLAGHDIGEDLEYVFGEEMSMHLLKGGMSPLQAAIIRGHIGTAKFLILSGCRIDTKQNHAQTSVHFASIADNCGALTFVFEHLRDIKEQNLVPNPRNYDAHFFIKHVVNMCDRYGRTPLHYASTKEMIDILISSQADVNIRDSKGHTPLLNMAKYKLTASMIDSICKSGNVSINMCDNAHRNTLHIVVRSRVEYDGIIETIIKLATLGLDFNFRTYNGETPLLSATKMYPHPVIRKPNLESKIIQTMAECGANMNAMDKYGKTALYYCIERKDINKTQSLLINGANPVAASFAGCPVLYLCSPTVVSHFLTKTPPLYVDNSIKYHYNFLLLLTKYVSNINITDEKGNNMLHLIAQSNVKEINDHISLLLAKGIDMNAKNNKGAAAVLLASGRSLSLLQSFSQKECKIDICDNQERNALFYIATVGPLIPSIVDYLLERGLSANHRNINNQTPLHNLVSSKNSTVECVKYYITKDADVCLTDANGKGVFHYLFMRGQHSCHNFSDILNICTTLIDSSADVNTQDNDGNSAVMSLCNVPYNFELVKTLFENTKINKKLRNNEGHAVLHLLIQNDKSEENNLIKLINVLQENQYDFNVCDNLGKPALLCAIEKNLLEITFKLFALTDVNDTFELQMKFCMSLFKSNILSTIIEDARNDLDQDKFKIPFGISKSSKSRSGELGAHLTIFLSYVKGVILPDGTPVPHSLIKSEQSDSVVEQVIKMFLPNRSILTVVDKDGRTALHIAIQYVSSSRNCRRINIIRLLLEHGANPNHRDTNGRTTLHYCIQSNRTDDEALEIMQYLLDKGGDPLLTNCKGKNVLDIITKMPLRLGVLSFIMKSFNLSLTDMKALEAVAFSVARQSDLSLQLISEMSTYITSGMEYNFVSRYKTKVIHEACRYCNLEAVFVYCRFSPMVILRELNMKDENGNTPLHILITSERLNKAAKFREYLNKMLSLEDRLDVDFFMHNFPKIMTHGLRLLHNLLQANADPNIKDKNGNSPLHLLLTSDWYGHCLVQAVDLLVKYGADVNQKNNKGVTPIMLAVGCGRLDCRLFLVRTLLNNGAKVDHVDNENHDIIWYAQKSMYATAFEILRDRHPDMSLFESGFVYGFQLMFDIKPDALQIDDLFSPGEY